MVVLRGGGGSYEGVTPVHLAAGVVVVVAISVRARSPCAACSGLRQDRCITSNTGATCTRFRAAGVKSRHISLPGVQLSYLSFQSTRLFPRIGSFSYLRIPLGGLRGK